MLPSGYKVTWLLIVTLERTYASEDFMVVNERQKPRHITRIVNTSVVGALEL